MPSDKKLLGDFGEDAAAKYLKKNVKKLLKNRVLVYFRHCVLM